MNNHSKITTEYNKNNTVAFTIRLNNKTDADIIEALETVNNRNALVKRLLRDAIADSENDDNGARSEWLNYWVEDPEEEDGGHYNGLICSRCKANGTARPVYYVYRYCPDCGAAMFTGTTKT